MGQGDVHRCWRSDLLDERANGERAFRILQHDGSCHTIGDGNMTASPVLSFPGDDLASLRDTLCTVQPLKHTACLGGRRVVRGDPLPAWQIAGAGTVCVRGRPAEDTAAK